MTRITCLVLACLITAQTLPAQDAFGSVRCGEDVVKTLVGKREPTGRVVVTQSQYASINLKNEGGTIISDSLFLSGWSMCGKQYEYLVDRRNLIRDAVLFEHSRARPGFIGECQVDGRPSSDGVLAILDIPKPLPEGRHYAANDSTLVPALVAWRIDEVQAKLVKIPTQGLRCPRNRIFTVDGGP
jgi:hypothetical protein